MAQGTRDRKIIPVDVENPRPPVRPPTASRTANPNDGIARPKVQDIYNARYDPDGVTQNQIARSNNIRQAYSPDMLDLTVVYGDEIPYQGTPSTDIYSLSDWNNRVVAAAQDYSDNREQYNDPQIARNIRQSLPAGVYVATNTPEFAQLSAFEQQVIREHNAGVKAEANKTQTPASELPIAIIDGFAIGKGQTRSVGPLVSANWVVIWPDNQRRSAYTTDNEFVPGSNAAAPDAPGAMTDPPVTPTKSTGATADPPAGTTQQPGAAAEPPAGTGALAETGRDYREALVNQAQLSGAKPAGSSVSLGDLAGQSYGGMNAAQLGTISSDTDAVTQFLLKQQGRYSPSSQAMYSPAMEQMPMLFLLQNAANIDINPEDLMGADANSISSKVFERAMSNAGSMQFANEFLGLQQGAGLDPVKAMRMLVGGAATTPADQASFSALQELANSGDAKQQVDFVKQAVEATMVNANPYMSGLITMLVEALGTEYLSTGGSEDGFMNWLIENSFFGGFVDQPARR